jgi:hypothetical protein
VYDDLKPPALAPLLPQCAPQVTYVSGLDQGGLISSQAVVTFRCVGPTTNRKTTLANCQENTKGRWLGLRDSVATSEVKKATDTWWPSKSVL